MSASPSKSKRWILALALCAGLAIALGGWLVANWQPSIDDLRTACKRAAQMRQWDRLRDLGSQWTTLDPQSGEARMFQATAFEAHQQYQAAADTLGQVPETAPEAESAMESQMELQFGPLNLPREGALTAEKIIRLKPQSLIAQQRLIFFLTMTLQRNQLNRQIRSAMKLGTEPPESYVYLFFRDSLFFANGIELNGQWMEGEPDSELFSVAQAVFIAESLDSSLSMDDREAAQSALRAQTRKVEVLEMLLQKYPHNVELLAYQLRDCMLTGKVDRAIELLAQSPVEALEDNRFWRFKGWIHSQTGEAKEAEEAYRQAIKVHPLDWLTRHLLADLLLRQNRLPEVERLRNLVNQASELRRGLQRAPSARQVPRELLRELADYAAKCGDDQVATMLPMRLKQYAQPATRPTGAATNQ